MTTLMDGQSYRDQVFSNVTLATPKLTRTEFDSCVFENCNFREATLYACRFSNCVFSGCDLGLAKLPNCRFIEVEFKQSKLIGIDWTTVGTSSTDLIMFSVGFEGCVLDFSSFYGMSIAKTKMRDCSAKEADFTETDLSEADLRGTDFEASTFLHTTLEKANLIDARNYAIDPLLNKIRRAKFSLPDAVSLLATFEIKIEGA
jgi:uncharacterized protein YjbI with pentapeptide repeats